MSLFEERVTNDLHRLVAATGRRAYLIGSLHGGFPNLGHHLPGEMGGLWTPPVKLADGFWFGISQQSLHDVTGDQGNDASDDIEWMYGHACSGFTMQPGVVQREFLLCKQTKRNGRRLAGAAIEACQRLFVPDEEPGVLVDVTLHNRSEDTVRLVLSWLVRWDIQGAWWSHWPDRPDEARFMNGQNAIVAWDSGHPEWSGAMLSDRPAGGHRIDTGMCGPEQTSSLLGVAGAQRGGILPNPEELKGAGISGRLAYDLTIEPGERITLSFALAGGVVMQAGALQKAAELLARRDELLRMKISRQAALVLAAPGIKTPQPSLDRAYSLQNLCMDMLTQDVPGSAARGAVAGLPSFAWFFGCDTYYSISGLLLAGQAETAISNLRLLASYAREQGMRIPHEITPTGRLFNPGNTVETAQFVISVERVYRWTADRAFLEEMYDVCKEGIFDYLLGQCDPGQTYLPDGPGMLELRSAGRGRKLDVAAALHQALRSLAYMAASLGKPETTMCEELLVSVRQNIDRYFWVEDRGEYVWRIEQDLSVWPDEPAQSYSMMEMGVLDGSDARDAARIAALFEKVAGPEHTGPRGMIHPGTSDFVMPVGNTIVALAEFQYGRADSGLWYLQRAAELCDRAMPWAIPEFDLTQADAVYKPCFLQLWSSAMYNWLAVQGWFRLLPDPDRGVVLVRPQLPSDWQGVQVKNLTLWGKRYDLSLRRKEGEIELTVVPLDGGSNHPFEVEYGPTLPVVFV